MPALLSKYINTPLEELDLEHRIWKHLAGLGCRTVGDLISLEETILGLYFQELMEGIERVKRDHAPPPNF